jgi:hypothetical protein
MVVAGRLMGVNLDTKGLYIPDHLVSHMRQTGAFVTGLVRATPTSSSLWPPKAR